jgi:tetratricopeptide (TPR) repeat protein
LISAIYRERDPKDKNGQTRKAIEDYMDVLERFGRSQNKDMADAHIALAQTYLNMLDYSTALRQYKLAEQTYKMNPKNYGKGTFHEVIWAQAFCERGLKDYKAAEPLLRQIVDKHLPAERKIQEYGVLCECLYANGKPAEAKKYQEKLDKLIASDKVARLSKDKPNN